jgi:hypothetical protein
VDSSPRQGLFVHVVGRQVKCHGKWKKISPQNLKKIYLEVRRLPQAPFVGVSKFVGVSAYEGFKVSI